MVLSVRDELSGKRFWRSGSACGWWQSDKKKEEGAKMAGAWSGNEETRDRERRPDLPQQSIIT